MENRTLKERLFDEPYRFEFFQAARLFERLFPGRKAVGGVALPAEEPVRFRSRIALDFPSSEIHEIHVDNTEDPDKPLVEMLINFMGMVGPSGALPTHYTELVLDRIRHRDTAMWAFLDIFTHRCVSMFFRAWAKYRFPVAYERGHDDFTAYLFDITGLGTDGLRGRMGLQDESLLPYSGLISQKPHSATAIENVLGDYFRIEANVLQFFGQWLDLTKDDITYLGVKNSSLGTTAIIGSRVWDQQSKFRVQLGPLSFVKFQAFLPSGSAHAAFRSILKFMVGLEYDFDAKLVLKAQQVPSLILTTRAVRKPMLGWTTWLKTKPFKQDDEQVVLSMN
ncbi:MAG: type VI secretion system baseplate subunit TssG [Blastocatellia bacterium]|nr:type VI secretion system baseplate subunit TssG [Blastocatellia bacterium]